MSRIRTRTLLAVTLILLAAGILLLSEGGMLEPVENIILRPISAIQSWIALRYSAVRDFIKSPSDLAELRTRNAELELEVAQLQQEIIAAQQQVIQDLSTPVIPVMHGIIVMPLVGNIDSMRAQDITRSLLAGISQHRARIVIIDVTGVSLMDTGIVDRLNKTIQAARLKGAQTIVTGISDAIAESIVDLGIDWSEITTVSNLQMGLHAALAGMGLHIASHNKSKI